MTVYRLEAAFGFGPVDLDPNDDTPGAWLDLTGLLTGPDGPRISVERGRDRDASPVTPGTLTARLYAGDGDLDGFDLRPGTPIRLSLDGERLFTGWAAEWPAVLEGGTRWVDLEAHDLGGLIAQADAPGSAFVGEANALAGANSANRPVAWWRPGPAGWTDSVTGRTGRHTTITVEADLPLAVGGTSWVSPEEVTGAGVLPGSLVDLSAEAGYQLVTMLVRPTGHRFAGSLLAIRHDSGAKLSLEIHDASPQSNLGSERVAWLYVSGDGWGAETQMQEPVDLPAGITTVVGFEIDPELGHVMVKVDGRDIAYGPIMTGGTGPDATGHAVTIVGSDGAIPDAAVPPPAGGPTVEVDHVIAWPRLRTSDDTVLETETAMQRLTSAARLAWAGDDLGTRTRRILTGAGIPAAWIDAAPSAIVTRQGYRAAAVPELLDTIADTEQGTMAIDRYGRLVSRPRAHWLAPIAYFGDHTAPQILGVLAPLPIAYESAEVIDGHLAGVVNVAQVTSEHGLMQTVEDHDSIARYGRRAPIHLSGLLHPSDRQSRTIAEWLVYSRAEPDRELVEFTVDTRAPIPEQWEHGYGGFAALLALLDVGDAIVTAAEGIPPTLAQILGIRHEITDTTHRVAFTVTTAHHQVVDHFGIGRPHRWFLVDETPIGDAALTL